MYDLLKKILFSLNAETSHKFSLTTLQLAHNFHLLKLFVKPIKKNPTTIMGLEFPNRVGLAAGLDKNANYINTLAQFGFGFIEIGTVTPRPQLGNAQPRLFRLLPQQALINRMGFNNDGVEKVARRLEKNKFSGILGINIGKNRDTELDHAIDDYLICFRRLAFFASYIAINISSPNTTGLCDLQKKDFLIRLVSALKNEQAKFATKNKKYVPLVVKISPDLATEELKSVAEVLLANNIDGVIATNTTIQRSNLNDAQFANEEGGLSGKPLDAQSTEVIKKLAEYLTNKIPIIASGGVMDAQSAQEKFAAGASLIQIYTGFIFSGAMLIQDIAAL